MPTKIEDLLLEEIRGVRADVRELHSEFDRVSSDQYSKINRNAVAIAMLKERTNSRGSWIAAATSVLVAIGAAIWIVLK